MTLREVALKAIEIYNAHAEAEFYDAKFDAGELSGPAHCRMADKEAEELAKTSGFTIDQIHSEIGLITDLETEAGYDKWTSGWIGGN